MGRKQTILDSNGGAVHVGHVDGSARPRKSIAREAFRPLRLRGRRELVRAMVDALNDILQSERVAF